MGRFLWAWFWGLLIVICSVSGARADEAIIPEVRVCVRPPNVPPNVQAWSYTHGSATVIVNREIFRERSRGFTVYTYDPYAPPENTALLPIPYNKLPCAAKPPPSPAPPAPEPKKDNAPKPDPKKPAVVAAAPATAPAAASKKKEEAPDPLPPPIVYPRKDKAPDEPHPRPPANGVTAQWPSTVLPVVRRDVDTTTRVLPQTTVLPIVRRDVDIGPKVLPTGTVLPMAGKSPDSGGGEGKGSGGTAKDGTADGTGVQKTALDKIAEEMAYAGAIANQQFNEDTKNPDGKRYGIPGGKNPNGPNSPAAQAAAGATLVVVGVISAAGLEKQIKEAVAKGQRLIFKHSAKAAEAAEKLVESFVKKFGPVKGKGFLAGTLNQNGAIGPYSMMKKFTDGMGGKMQAHHILERSMADKFKLGDPDKIPSVILTDAQHKAITAKLALKTPRAKTLAELWAAYEDVYKNYPDWLEAIKPYFGKAP